jgi:hypothetical protein
MININILFGTRKNIYLEHIYGLVFGTTKFEPQSGMLAVPNEDFLVVFFFSDSPGESMG